MAHARSASRISCKTGATVRRFNETTDWLAGEAFALKSGNKIALQKTHYAPLRERFGLSAQMAVRCIAEVCSASKRDRKIRPHFRPFAAVPYDRRIASWKSLDRISLLTLAGRILVPYDMGKYQRERFTGAKGQCDLVRRKDGRWFLLVSVDLPDETRLPATDFIGVDFGVINIARTTDGKQHSGEGIEAFFQLRAFVTYKAILAGVDLRIVDPRGTSRTCNACGFEAKANRKSQAEFVCGECGHAADADVNAAKNIRSRALVDAPIVADLCAA